MAWKYRYESRRSYVRAVAHWREPGKETVTKREPGGTGFREILKCDCFRHKHSGLYQNDSLVDKNFKIWVKYKNITV